MGIISYSKEVIIQYIPEYGENRRTESPCIVSLHFIPFGEAREQQLALAAKNKGMGTQEKAMAIAQALQKENFTQHIEKVHGYSLHMVDGQLKEITDAEEFYLTAPTELITEVLEAMQDAYKLSKGQAKNFERAFVGISS